MQLNPDAKLPTLATGGSAGMDLCALRGGTLEPGARMLVGTGLAVQLPAGYHLEIRPRSGLALKHGVSVLNSPGTVDADYRGELAVLLFNFGQETFVIEAGARIAQAVLMRHEQACWQWRKNLASTERGLKGWGHSGY